MLHRLFPSAFAFRSPFAAVTDDATIALMSRIRAKRECADEPGRLPMRPAGANPVGWRPEVRGAKRVRLTYRRRARRASPKN